MSLIDQIISYENGDMQEGEALQLFSTLIKTGQAWSLQGHYGRTARHLIDAGFISESGKIICEL
jgi:hypothetical protein